MIITGGKIEIAVINTLKVIMDQITRSNVGEDTWSDGSVQNYLTLQFPSLLQTILASIQFLEIYCKRKKNKRPTYLSLDQKLGIKSALLLLLFDPSDPSQEGDLVSSGAHRCKSLSSCVTWCNKNTAHPCRVLGSHLHAYKTQRRTHSMTWRTKTWKKTQTQSLASRSITLL